MSETVLEWQAAGRHIVIRDIESQQDLTETENIQREVWGFSELDVVPSAHMIAARWAGGVLLGAYESGRMIGFVYGFPAMESGHLSMHSHMLAVRKDSRRLRAGIHLKLAQRKRALEMGMREISWTFDPLQSLNARLNFSRLGVVSQRYLIDFYGEETSSPLHRGVGTDRLWVRWLIDSDRVKARVSEIEAQDTGEMEGSGATVRKGAGPGSEQELELGSLADIEKIVSSTPERTLLVRQNGNWRHGNLAQFASAADVLFENPVNIQDIKDKNVEDALVWRKWIQGSFLAAFERGLTAKDFIGIETMLGPRCFYLLSPM